MDDEAVSAIRRRGSATITGRRVEIIALVAQGYSNADIGTQLHLSPHTVKTQLVGIARILGARNRAHIVHLAYRCGILATADQPAPSLVSPVSRVRRYAALHPARIFEQQSTAEAAARRANAGDRRQGFTGEHRVFAITQVSEE